MKKIVFTVAELLVFFSLSFFQIQKIKRHKHLLRFCFTKMSPSGIFLAVEKVM